MVAYSAKHKNQHSDVSSCTIVYKMHVEQRFFVWFCGMENRVTLYNVVDIFKFSCASRRDHKTITTPVVWKILLIKHLSYDADKKLVGTPHLFSLSTWICKFILLTFCILIEINDMLKRERSFTVASGNKICDWFVTVVNKNVSHLCVTPCVVTNTEVSKEWLGCNIEVEKWEAV